MGGVGGVEMFLGGVRDRGYDRESYLRWEEGARVSGADQATCHPSDMSSPRMVMLGPVTPPPPTHPWAVLERWGHVQG